MAAPDFIFAPLGWVRDKAGTGLVHVSDLFAGAGAGSAPSQLSIKSQTSLAATGASQSLPTAPAGTTYALIQIKAQTLWFRLDATTAVSGGAAEQFIDSGGTLELTSAAEITGFRGIQASGGVLGIVYRGA